MFDNYSRYLFEGLPEFEGLSPRDARRALSRAYASVTALRVSGARQKWLPDVTNYLRRLANSLESRALFDPEVREEDRRGCAFVAAEALALLAEINSVSNVDEKSQVVNRMQDPSAVVRLEAALLYIIGHFDSNASGVLRPVEETRDNQERVRDQAADWCFSILKAFCEYRLRPLPVRECPVGFASSPVLSVDALVEDTLGRLYGHLGTIVADYMHWLAGRNQGGLELTVTQLENVIEALVQQPDSTLIPVTAVGNEYSLIHHLAVLLNKAIHETATRSLVHVVPPPYNANSSEFRAYLKGRAMGGRPVLWPSVMSYVQECVIGKARNAVVSMPTGSGKSFLAEIAITQQLFSGWVLYLVPTNALAAQVRRDLRRDLRKLGTAVSAFVGDEEFTTLATDTVTDVRPNLVVVMTPEKCSLALRLNPEAFARLSLVVVDECHLLDHKSSGRGVTTELVLSQIMIKSSCRFLLMSALLQNAQELADWLSRATNSPTVALTKAWRPTRTLRAAVGISAKHEKKAYEEAKNQLSSRRAQRKNEPYEAQLAVIYGLQGAWESTEYKDYGAMTLPVTVPFQVHREQDEDGEWVYNAQPISWVNDSAGILAKYLADHGLQTLVFIPTNRHYPFSVADDVALEPSTVRSLSDLPPVVPSCRSLAEYELGVKSDVFPLLERGISVHTAAMLETEQVAAELAFAEQSTRVMFATSTLAQGLNLPAVAVIIAGTQIGDTRNDDPEAVERRKLSQLLNAAGRAGRAGYANQGLVLAIPDKFVPLQVKTDILDLRKRLGYLQQPDSAIAVSSGLESFLNGLENGTLSNDAADLVELQAIAALAGSTQAETDPTEVLKHSFAAFRRWKAGRGDLSTVAAARLVGMRAQFLRATKAPSWVPLAAQNSGLDFWSTAALFAAWRRVEPELSPKNLNRSVSEWAALLLRIIAHVPPGIIIQHLELRTIDRFAPDIESFLKRRPWLLSERRVEWQLPIGWQEGWLKAKLLLRPWLRGDSLAEIATVITKKKVHELSTARTAGSQPIPKAILLASDAWSSLSILAGGLVAIVQCLLKEWKDLGYEGLPEDLPLPLNCLPMCIRFGFDSPESLAWFRFGARLRRPAHLLNEVFPIPSGLSDREQRAWVITMRRQWLRDPHSAPTPLQEENIEVLSALHSFLKATGRF